MKKLPLTVKQQQRDSDKAEVDQRLDDVERRIALLEREVKQIRR